MKTPYRRFVVVGTTGSGKSTLAEQLAKKLDLDFIELDALYWEPNWVEAPGEVFQARVELATRSEGWAVAGNYGRVRNIVWSRAQAVVWLDYSLGLIYKRLIVRSVRRWWTQELLWGTNRERLYPHLKLWSDESLFKWALKTYWRRKREIPQFLKMPEYSHLTLFHFKTPQQTHDWLESLSAFC